MEKDFKDIAAVVRINYFNLAISTKHGCKLGTEAQDCKKLGAFACIGVCSLIIFFTHTLTNYSSKAERKTSL